MYLKKHETLTSIAKTLQKRNVKTKTDSEWATSTIKNILTNPIYVGKVRYSLHDESKYFEAEGKGH